MGLRVKLRLKTTRRVIETSALINTGFETPEPEIIIPPRLASILGLMPSNEFSSYMVAGGGQISAIRSRSQLKVSIKLDDKVTSEVDAVALIVFGEEEVIVSDRLAHELGIVIIDPFNGLWCLRDELGERVRSSVEAEYWAS